jgi:tRNA pseudouridine32 synthase/23S rRNA pseudouridine746 synthase
MAAPPAAETLLDAVLSAPTFQAALNIVHVDDALIVLDKPAGLLAVPGRGTDKQDCLSARVQQRFADALVVHRLDMDTSGLICLARGTEAQRQLSMAFAQRLVSKRYVAVVDGVLNAPDDDWGIIDLPLICDWPNRPRSKVDFAIGKPSTTRWRVLSRTATSTRLELEPVTGRSHQLRVHLAAIGHAIVGDPLYGSGHDASGRMMLHASAITLPHPTTGEAMSLKSPPPF